MNEQPATIEILREQGVKLMAVCVLIKDGSIDLRGHDQIDVAAARAAILDVAEECALQLGGLYG